MPPTAASRKAAALNNTAGGDPSNASNSRRTTSSGRAIRSNTTRPVNYYARPYAQHDQDAGQDENTNPAGFFPALTFFTDAVTALPKEVMRHFTLMKEVEAKVHGPNERLGEVVDALLQHPVPRRKDGASAAQGGLLSLTRANSAMGSANVSLVNGVAPYGVSGLNSAAGSTEGEESMHDAEDDMARRREYHELRMLTRDLLANVDEKNVVLTEANRVLDLQMMRFDSVMPYVDAEIPEEARLGSMTHWAYSDNRQKTKPAVPVANERNRRDVAATNSLAAAASAIHETEIATARREATKDATREKHGKGKNKEHVDSEFEERPKKTGAKTGKGKAAQAAVTGLGISTNGEPVKRRKVDKTALPLGMERQLSSTGRGKAARETPRSTPATETTKKPKTKAPPPPPKRKGLNSAQNSPALASTPLQASFSPAVIEPPSGRAQSARLRQNSTATNLRHEALAEGERSRPPSSAGKPPKEKSNGRKRAREEAEEPEQTADADQSVKLPEREMKREDTTSNQRPPASRSNSSNKASGKQSKVSTPRAEPSQPHSASEAPMLRTRSTRSLRANGDTPSSEPPMQGRPHKRSAHGGSMSGLMKQIAPFNKSPDHHRGSGHEDDDDLDSQASDTGNADNRFAYSGRRSGTNSRAGSRAVSRARQRGHQRTQDQAQTDEDTEMPNATHDRHVLSTREGNSPAPDQDHNAPGFANSPSPSPELSSHPGSPPAPAPPQRLPSHHTPQPPPFSSPSPSPSPSPSASPSPPPEPTLPTTARHQEPSASPSPDPDDPSEPKYCYCQRGSYGDMVGCDNPKCEREWFHLACTDLGRMPGEEESWFCEVCRPRVGGGGRGRRGGRGGRGK